MSNIINRATLSKQVSDELEDMIENGVYAVGEKIPTEPVLMDMFQVSRNTIREAIQGLTIAGLLEVKQGSGTFVRSNNRFQANLTEKYSNISLEDIREARNSIEVTIAHLAAIRRTGSDCERITEKFQKRQTQTTDIKENTKADIDFHIEIAKSCHNIILIDLYSSITTYLEAHIQELTRETSSHPETIEALHYSLYEAIMKQNPEKAAQAAQRIVNL